MCLLEGGQALGGIKYGRKTTMNGRTGGGAGQQWTQGRVEQTQDLSNPRPRVPRQRKVKTLKIKTMNTADAKKATKEKNGHFAR